MADASVPDRKLPVRFGPYEVCRSLGHGGHGSVYLCQQAGIGGHVAVKCAADGDSVACDTLRREITILLRLSRTPHPGIVRVLDHGVDQRTPWFAMTYVRGDSLERFRQHHWDTPGELSSALRLVQELASTLAFIHDQGTIHGDLSPRNVIVATEGTPVLFDFGVSALLASTSLAREVLDVNAADHCTPGYAAPEQLAREVVDSRCDLYALGCILYELVTGAPPFIASDAERLRLQHLEAPPVPPSKRVDGIPPELDRLILALLAKRPLGRIGFAREVVVQLGRLLGAPPRRETSLAPRTHLFRAPMAGRRRPLERLTEHLRRSHAGHGALVVLDGESGIGKTRLALELGRRALREGSVVVGSACRPPHQEHNVQPAPFGALWPLLSRLRGFCETKAGEALRARIAESLVLLARYTALQEPNERAQPSPSHTDFQPIFAAFDTCLFEFSRESHLVLLLDDLQWADAPTLSYLRATALCRTRGARVLVIATHRRESSQPFERALEAMPADIVELARLELQDTRSLVRETLGFELVPAGFVQFIHAHSEGNPLLIAEYLRAAVSSGLLKRRVEGGWSFAGSHQLKQLLQLLPDSVRGLFELRGAGLSPTARELLVHAALVGRSFEVAQLEEVMKEIGRSSWLDLGLALDELVMLRFLERVSGGCYQFTHDKAREACLGAIDDAARPALHLTLARCLERTRKDASQDAELAIHWAKARQPRRALNYLLPTAQRLAAAGAGAHAVDLLQLALEQAKQIARNSATWPSDGWSCIVTLVSLLLQLARPQDALWHIAQAEAYFPGHATLEHARLHRLRGAAHRMSKQYAEALQAYETAAGVLSSPAAGLPSAFRDEWIEVQLAFAGLHYHAAKDPESMKRHLAKIEPHLDAAATPLQRSRYYMWSANALVLEQRYQYCTQAVAFERMALELLARDAEHLAEAAMAEFDLAFMLLLGGEPECREALGLLQSVARRASTSNEAILLARSFTYLAIAARRLRNPDLVRTYAQQSCDYAAAADQYGYLGAAKACLAWLAWHEDRVLEARDLATEACRLWWRNRGELVDAARDEFPFQWLALLPLVCLHAGENDYEAAIKAASQSLRFPQQRLPVPLQRALETLVSTPNTCGVSDVSRQIARVTRLAFEHRFL